MTPRCRGCGRFFRGGLRFVMGELPYPWGTDRAVLFLQDSALSAAEKAWTLPYTCSIECLVDFLFRHRVGTIRL